jgi:hypothetical protein
MGPSVETNPNVASPVGEREVRYEHSLGLAGLLEGLNASLVVSTYQAGKLAVIGSHREQLAWSFHNFDRPMGVAIDRQASTLAVAARNKVWLMKNARDVATQLEPAGSHAACFLTRSAHVTGEIRAHEMAWAGDELWIVNTLFSCLCTLHPDYSFVPRWQPRFISALAPEDRCHLNGLALLDGKPKYVTVMAESDSPGGWRPNKVDAGCLVDVESGETVARVPGYTRGLAMIGKLAFVGLSKIRETSTFGGVPIAENRERLKCGVGVVDLLTGELAGQLEFTSGVDEIFDVSLLPGSRRTALRGPFAGEDGERTIWRVPAPGSR